MRPPYICLNLRRQIVGSQRLTPSLSLQWRTTSSLATLPSDQATTTGKSLEDQWLDLATATGSSESLGALPSPFNLDRHPPVRSQCDQNAQAPEILFEERSERSITARGVTQADEVLEAFENVRKLQQLLEQRDLSKAWDYLLLSFGTDPSRHGSKYGSKVRALALRLWSDILQAKKKDPLISTLPTATVLTKTYLRLGYLHGNHWCDLMNILLSQAINKETELMKDMLGMWNILCCQSSRITTDDTKSTFPLDWSELPSMSRPALLCSRKHKRVIHAFGSLMPSISPEELQELPIISMAFFRLLYDHQDRNQFQELVKNAQPLIFTLASLLHAHKMDMCRLKTGYIDKENAVYDYVQQGWPSIWSQITRTIEASGRSSMISQSRRRASQSRPHREIPRILNKRLRVALAEGNTAVVDDLWEDASKYVVDCASSSHISEDGDIENSALQKQSVLTIGLANYFIFVYLALGKPDRAVDVWNHMVQNRLSPTLHTWASMMMGCQRSKNLLALEGVWAKMVHVYPKPSVACWNIRIRALIDLNRIDLGLNALNQMGRRWLQEAQLNGERELESLRSLGDVNGVVKPTIETINAAVGAVLRKKKPDLTRRILEWAAKFGMQPNVTTYNTLLRPLIRANEDQKVVQLLEQMQAQNVQADVATFTTILEETFRHTSQYTPEQQTQLINSVFTHMEAMGIQPDLQVYGKIIYELLNNKNDTSKKDMAVVRAVLDRMFDQGLRPTSHIHTIIAEHYFDQDLPTLPAVEALIERVKLEPGSVDHVFWDRIIEGYARRGETNRAMKILQEQRSGDGRVSWLTIRTLLAALVNNEDWSNADKLVRIARIEWGGPLPSDIRGSEGRHAFWNFAAELNLL